MLRHLILYVLKIYTTCFGYFWGLISKWLTCVTPPPPPPAQSVICLIVFFSPCHIGLCNPIKCSTPGFPILHYLPEFAETRPLSQWCHPTSHPLLSCPQSFPASGSFPVSQFFTSDGQSIGASASATVLPVNFQHWFPLGLTVLISLLKGLLSLLQHHSTKALTLRCSAFFMVQFLYLYVTAGKTIALSVRTFVSKVMSASE